MSTDPTKPEATASAAAALKLGPWNEERKPKRRDFPGRGTPGAAVRASFTATAYSDVTQHAKSSLKAEICGVLVGTICSDDHGLWVDITASLRGAATSNGSAHVTFTQDTWKQIHSDLERLHPKLRIVGWYHSHPGFGVVFSEMDAFIQRNFFSGPGQIALVTDPLSGEEACCCTVDDGIQYLEQCLIDGRERTLKRPTVRGSSNTSGGNTSGGTSAPLADGGSNERLAALETRITQLVTSLDDLRERAWHFNLLVGMLVVFAVVLFIGWQIWSARMSDRHPPEVFQEVSVPLRLGDKDVQLFARIYKWEMPPELRSEYKMLLELAVEKQAAEEQRKADEATMKSLQSKPEQKAAQPTGSP